MAQMQYKNHVITITADWRFKVTGPEFDGNGLPYVLESKAAAIAAIDRYVAAAAKQHQAETKVCVPALHKTGVVRTGR